MAKGLENCIGKQLEANCQTCNSKWNGVVLGVSDTGGVFMDPNTCPSCGAGYDSMFVRLPRG